MTDRSPQNQDKFVVRLPDGMRDRIRAAAEANGRSMNAEIVATLEHKYPAETLETFLLQMALACRRMILALPESEHANVIKGFKNALEPVRPKNWSDEDLLKLLTEPKPGDDEGPISSSLTLTKHGD